MYIQRIFVYQGKLYYLFIWESRRGVGLDSWSLSEWSPTLDYFRKVAERVQDVRPRSRRASVVRQIKEAGLFAS